MLENYEEINLDLILERAGLFRNEFETNEYQDEAYMTTILTKQEIKVWKRFQKERREQCKLGKNF